MEGASVIIADADLVGSVILDAVMVTVCCVGLVAVVLAHAEDVVDDDDGGYLACVAGGGEVRGHGTARGGYEYVRHGRSPWINAQRPMFRFYGVGAARAGSAKRALKRPVA